MKEKKGFTLIELLIILIIIGLLATVAGVKFGDTVRVTRIRKAKAEMQAKAVALRSFHMDCGGYPLLADPTTGYITTLAGWHDMLVAGNRLADGREKKYWAGPYLPKAKLDPWGNPYLFRDYSDPEDPRITAILCRGKDGIEEPTLKWTPGFKKLHPPDPRDGITIYYPAPGDKNTFDIIYWME